jgi:hypothetical protein
VAYYSRQYISAESHYPTHEQELLAVIGVMKHWRVDLLGVHFTVLTDHQKLVHLSTQPSLSKRQARWLEVLADYDYQIKYIPGEQNSVADALSRYAFPRREPVIMLAAISSASVSKDVLEEIKAGYTADPFVVQMIKNVKSTPGLELTDGVLWYENRMVIPEGKELREALLHDAHDALGHLGERKMFAALHEVCYWE